jgi:phosphohistidine phosphatase
MAHATTRTRRFFLVRHAIAAERGPAWPDECERPLTPDGARRMTQVVKGLRALGVDIDVVATSPLVRARQTADLLVAGIEPRPALVELGELSPGHSPAATVRALARATDAASIALVGHEPHLGELVAWLLGVREPIPFKKGGMSCIEVAAWPATPGSRLVWFAPPKMLRRLR